MPSSPFKPLGEAELQRLSADELIAHLREATAAGRPDSAKTALAVLCWRHHDDVVRRVRLRVPREEVEDVAMTTIGAAINSAFDGTSIGEFVVWLHRIVDRRGIADFHRAREGKPRPDPLPGENLGDEEVFGEAPSVDDESGAVAVQSVVDECLEPLSEAHRAVVKRNLFEDLGAAAAVARVNSDHPDLEPPMSTDNVHKIVSRFRQCVRERLADANSP